MRRMKLFEIDMTDVGGHSWEKYYVMAKDENEAWEYVIANNYYPGFEKRPHKIEAHGKGEVIIDIY